MNIEMKDTKQVLISLAIFITAMFAPRADAKRDVTDIDRKIMAAREKIKDQRCHRAQMVKRIVENNSDYKYVFENAAKVQRLRKINERLISRACDIVHGNSKSGVVVVAHTPMVFMLYAHKYPEINSLKTLYESNDYEIKHYEYHLDKIIKYEQTVKNHYDSIMYVEIDKFQRMIDSLLNEKNLRLK